MESNGRGVLGRWDATNEEIREAMAAGIVRALREHRSLGNPVVTWDRDRERIVIVPPGEIEVADDPGADRGSGHSGRESGS